MDTAQLRSYDQLYIGGRWVEATGADRIEVISPITEQVIAHVPEATPADVDAAVGAARSAFDAGPWPRLPVTDRIAVLRRFADLYGARLDELGSIITSEIGAPATFTVMAQTLAPHLMMGTLLDTAETHPWEDVRPNIMGGRTTVRRLPVGVVAAVVPWNVPQIVIMSKLIPALVAGCTVVLKPAPESPLDALWLAELFEAAGLPEGVLSIVPAGREVSEHLVTHPGVDKVAFTGSTTAGRRIAELCGARLKRVSLELGGKSAAIILEDADLRTTVKGLRFASFLNSGQACAAQTRVLAPRSRYGEIVDAFAEMVDDLVVGDPFDPATEIGPMVARRQQERVTGYIEIGTGEGARLAAGGPGRPAGLDRGWFVRPTLFVDADNSMRIAREEIFGPVLTVIPYESEEDAIRLADDSEFGLGGSVWTADVAHGAEVAGRVRTGTTGVNHYGADFASPFGGFKASGIGREYGPEGLDEYVELQSVSLLPD